MSEIIDYRMPLMSGLELTGEIKKLEPGTKVVFVSTDESVRQEAIEAGANVFLKKASRTESDHRKHRPSARALILPAIS